MAVISAREFKRVQEVKPEPIVSTAEPEEDFLGIAPRKKPKADDPWFYLEHPDNSPGNLISCKFDLIIGEDKESVEIERGRVETQVVAVKDELVKRGYRFMNEEF